MKKVAAYARVSSGAEHMLHSLAAQVSHYSNYIQSNKEWIYAGIYAEADETGTKDSRPEFQRLLADCRAGKIDIILTKAISRFARNTVTLLETVRELKALGIDVYFEEQNIHTLSNEGELMLTILASYAQEESRSVSENIKWRKRNDMANGKTKPLRVFGYEVVDHKLVIIPAQAEIIRLMFDMAIKGTGSRAIARELNRRGIPSSTGKTWNQASVTHILKNPKMCGDLFHQRTYIADHITKKAVRNRGELPMYRIEDTHEGIISREIFEAVQDGIKSRGAEERIVHESELRKLLKCAICGRTFLHKHRPPKKYGYMIWVCKGANQKKCNAKIVTDHGLKEAAMEVLGMEEYGSKAVSQQLEGILAGDGFNLTFILRDGSEVHTQWKRRTTGRRRECEENNGNPGNYTQTDSASGIPV